MLNDHTPTRNWQITRISQKNASQKGMGNLVIGRGRLKTSLSTFQRGLLPIVLASVAEGSYPWLFLKRIRQRGPALTASWY